MIIYEMHKYWGIKRSSRRKNESHNEIYRGSSKFNSSIPGQNDIKKLRRENEQLRREIWSLRDEYDKLEEILKRQKSRGESEEYEVREDDIQSWGD